MYYTQDIFFQNCIVESLGCILYTTDYGIQYTNSEISIYLNFLCDYQNYNW